MTSFWYLIFGLGVLAALVNFSLAFARRQQMMVAVVRGVAGLISLGLAIGIVVGKEVLRLHPPFVLEAQTVFIAAGVFVFAVLVLPSYVDRRPEDAKRPTLRERAARPANATVRLQTKGSDEWVN